MPGTRRSRGAVARAGIRIHGDPRIGNAGGSSRRGDESRVPARYRSAARRTGTSRDAQVPRAQSEPGACLPDRRADGRLERHAPDRNGRAHRCRLRCVLARGCAAYRYTTPAARIAVRGDFRFPGVAAATGCGACARRCCARRPGRHPPGTRRDPGLRGNGRLVDHPAARARNRRTHPPVQDVECRRCCHGAPGQAIGTQGELRYRHSSRPPVGNGHRLL